MSPAQPLSAADLRAALAPPMPPAETAETYEREALLLELTIDLATVLQFAGSLFMALRMSTSIPVDALAANAVRVHDDVRWLSAFLHEINRVTMPIAQGRYRQARAEAVMQSRWVAALSGWRDDGVPASHPWMPESLVVQAMQRRWAGTFNPPLPDAIDAFARLAQTCAGLQDSYPTRTCHGSERRSER